MEFLNEIRYINNLMIKDKIYTYNLYDNIINIRNRNIDKNKKKDLIIKIINKAKFLSNKLKKNKLYNNIY